MNQPAVIASHALHAAASGAGRARDRLGVPAVIFILLFAAALAPVLWFSIPAAMVDYSNHLARMFVLARDGTAQAQPYYQVNWVVIPNLAMDLLVPSLGRLIGVETAARLFYLASQILIVTGAMAIERAVKGRVHIAGFFALMFLYSMPFALGFVNFEFGLGCALWGIACALAVEERSWRARLAVHTAIILCLFAAHLFALGVYGFTIGVNELWRAWSRRGPWSETFGRLVLPALPTLVLVAVMFASGGAVGGHGTHWFFGYKPAWLFHVLSGYSMAASAPGVVALFALILALKRRGALRFERSGGWLAVAFAALYVAMPLKLFDTSFVDVRVLVAAALILPGFVSVSFPSRRWARAALAVAAAITLANVGVVTGVWLSYRADFAAAKASFLQLPKGAKVLIGHSGAGGDPPNDLTEYPIYSVPILAVQYADAFVPNMFTEAGKQPVSARAPWRRLDVPYAGPAPVALLKSIAEGAVPAGTPRFIRAWARDFDFLYLVGPKIANPMPERLVQVAAGPRFVLYRIKKPVTP
jgi:hypothetical protein